jgi:choline dehydrogenase
MDATIRPNGVRASASECYLPRAYPDRLRVETETIAHRILFEGRRAVGVEVVGPGGRERIEAGEVIVSLGAVGSPHLLTLSGVGPAAALQRLGVPVVHDAPGVGANLQDHLEVYVQHECLEPVSLYPYAALWGFGPEPLRRYLYRHPTVAAMSGAQWIMKGRGIAASNHFEVGGFIRTTTEMPHPDVQYHFIPACVDGQLDIISTHGYQAHVGTMRPTSRGSITITSPDISVSPEIDPQFLMTEDDIVDMRRAVRHTVHILSQPALDPFRGPRLGGLTDATIADDGALDDWIRSKSHSAYHLCSTCAMGDVVDGEGRVQGTENLRVVDASIMPDLASGNLNAPTIMMAEKIADAIRGRRLPPSSAEWVQPTQAVPEV